MALQSAALFGFIDGILSSLEAGEQPRKILEALERDHLARHEFAGGTHQLLLGGVAATWMTADTGLLLAWVRAAEQRLSLTPRLSALEGRVL